MFDSSPENPEKLFEPITKQNVGVFYAGMHPDIKYFSERGMRSQAECITFKFFLDWFIDQKIEAKKILKISGRYRITNDYDPTVDYKDSFVFAKSEDSWMPIGKQNEAEAYKLYKLRMWYMDYSLLNNFRDMLLVVFEDCLKYGIDIEHSYYKNIHKLGYKTVELDKIGVEGNIAPNGAYINE
jgi:hypothetical protein